VAIYNYQSRKEAPAVLAIVSSFHGTSAHVVTNKTDGYGLPLRVPQICASMALADVSPVCLMEGGFLVATNLCSRSKRQYQRLWFNKDGKACPFVGQLLKATRSG
jgi:hypothetical protein